MSVLERIKSAKKAVPRRTVIYGTSGIGKSTWASKWPGAVVIPTEDGISDIDVPAFPAPSGWGELGSYVEELINKDHDYRTLVIDSADWVEPLIWANVTKGEGSIADIPYGRGFQLAADKFGAMLKRLNVLRDRGVHVLFTAHSRAVRFEDPGGDAYDYYAPKLHKHTLALLTEWCDELLFAKYEVYTSSKDEGFGRSRHIAAGTGERKLYTSELPSFKAKNRLGLPASMSMDFNEYQPFLGAEDDG